MDWMEAMERRHSVRQYEARPLAEAAVEALAAEIAALRCGAGLSGAKERNGCYKRVTDGLRLYECLRRVKVNSSPPRSELRTEIVPPCIITAFLTIASPSPVPPSLRERPLSMR